MDYHRTSREVLLRAVSARSSVVSLARVDGRFLATVLLELAARVTLPGAALLVGSAGPSVRLVALATPLVVLVRGLYVGQTVERALARRWAVLVDAVERHDVAALQARPTEQRASTLAFAAQRLAQFEASLAPRAVADLLGLVVAAVASHRLLGWRWCALGALLALALAPLVLGLSRRVRVAEERGYAELRELVDELALLLDGAAELRAHGIEREHAARARAAALAIGAVRGRATVLRALSSVLPLALVLVAFAAPGLDEWLGLSRGFGTAAILGLLAIVCAGGLIAALDEIASVDPHRRALASFFATAKAVVSEPDVSARGRCEPLRELAFEDVSMRFAGATTDTPHRFSVRWRTERGLALVGANGAGKSTLARGLLGLAPIVGGSLVVDGEPWSVERAAALRAQLVFLPQRPLVLAGRDVGWHLRLLATHASDDALLAALEATELLPRLRQRSPEAPLAVLAGSLSGGEVARMQLARVLVARGDGEPALVVLDEPEGSLDVRGRALLRKLLAELSTRAPVLVVVHDEGVLPETFVRATCARGS